MSAVILFAFSSSFRIFTPNVLGKWTEGTSWASSFSNSGNFSAGSTKLDLTTCWGPFSLMETSSSILAVSMAWRRRASWASAVAFSLKKYRWKFCWVCNIIIEPTVFTFEISFFSYWVRIFFLLKSLFMENNFYFFETFFDFGASNKFCDFFLLEFHWNLSQNLFEAPKKYFSFYNFWGLN